MSVICHEQVDYLHLAEIHGQAPSDRYSVRFAGSAFGHRTPVASDMISGFRRNFHQAGVRSEFSCYHKTRWRMSFPPLMLARVLGWRMIAGCS